MIRGGRLIQLFAKKWYRNRGIHQSVNRIPRTPAQCSCTEHWVASFKCDECNSSGELGNDSAPFGDIHKFFNGITNSSQWNASLLKQISQLLLWIAQTRRPVRNETINSSTAKEFKLLLEEHARNKYGCLS